MNQFLDRMYQELRIVQERRIKLSVLQLTFVTALLGIGVARISIGQSAKLSPAALYLAPLVAVLFDTLMIGSTASIKRIAAFLRVRDNDSGEKDWLDFLERHQAPFAWIGAVGCTLVTFVVAFMALCGQDLLKSNCAIAIWLVCICVIWIALRLWESKVKKHLREIKTLESSCAYGFRWFLGCQKNDKQ